MFILSKCLENILVVYIISVKMNIIFYFGFEIIKFYFIKVIIICYIIIVFLVCLLVDYEVYILGKEDIEIM